MELPGEGRYCPTSCLRGPAGNYDGHKLDAQQVDRNEKTYSFRIALTTAFEKGAEFIVALMTKDRLRVGRSMRDRDRDPQSPILQMRNTCSSRTDVYHDVIAQGPPSYQIRRLAITALVVYNSMDPRHQLYKQLDNLDIDSENQMSARTDTEAASEAASSGVTPDVIKQRLEEGLGATHVEIEDMSGRSRL
jgi:hypothetical protein